MAYRDLREFIGQIDALGSLRHVAGAGPRHEIGAVKEVAAGMAESPALLFDSVMGSPLGFRILTNAVTNPQRAALALGIDPALHPLGAQKAWTERRRALTPHPPVETAKPPFLENSRRGAEVDLRQFPGR